MSYSKVDREVVSQIVMLLELQGWSVWWDTRIGGGEQWDDVIEREIEAAKCVLVVWSPASAKSRWVRTEAHEGLERGILVPVVIDSASPPLGFKLIQWTDLSGWQGEGTAPSTRRLVEDVQRVAGVPAGRNTGSRVRLTQHPAPDDEEGGVEPKNGTESSHQIRTAQLTFVGSRSEQQDAVGVRLLGDSIDKLLVVADGFGSEGVRASNTAVTGFRRAADHGDFDHRGTRSKALRNVLLDVNRKIGDLINNRSPAARSGTTLVAAIVSKSSIQWISVGGSHLLLYRFPDVIKLNKDQSKTEPSSADTQGRDTGTMSRKMLLSMLDGRDISEIDIREEPLELQWGDIIILATDGLLDALSGDEIGDIVSGFRQEEPQSLARELIAKVQAKNLERQDNIAIAVANIPFANTAADRNQRSRSWATRGISSVRSARRGSVVWWLLILAALAIVGTSIFLRWFL